MVNHTPHVPGHTDTTCFTQVVTEHPILSINYKTRKGCGRVERTQSSGASGPHPQPGNLEGLRPVLPLLCVLTGTEATMREQGNSREKCGRPWMSLTPIILPSRDTAGQERFRTITTAYYRGAMVLTFSLFLWLSEWKQVTGLCG